MSDFGSIINIKKPGGEAFTADEQAHVRDIVEQIRREGDYRDFTGEALEFDEVKSDDTHSMGFVFTRHWHGEDDDEETREENLEFAIGNESPQLEQIAKTIRELLRFEVSTDIEFTPW